MSTSEEAKALLAIESISQMMRGTRYGKCGPAAIEGLCKYPNLMEMIGRAIQRGSLSSFEIERFVDRHIRFVDNSMYGSHLWPSSFWIRRHYQFPQSVEDGVVRPNDFEKMMRGNIRFTKDQLEILKRIPFSIETLTMEQKTYDALLFPGHPDVTLAFLLEAFHENTRSHPCFAPVDSAHHQEAEEFQQNGLDLGWYLIRRRPEPGVDLSFQLASACFDERVLRMPRAVEFATAALLTGWQNFHCQDSRLFREFKAEDSLLDVSAWTADDLSIIGRHRYPEHLGGVNDDNFEEKLKAPKIAARWIVGPYAFNHAGPKSRSRALGLEFHAWPEQQTSPGTRLFLIRRPEETGIVVGD